MKNINTIKLELIDFVKTNSFRGTNNLNENSKIFQEGIFDSMGFALLIDFLENSYGIVTNDEDMVEENFESVNAISDYIQKKQ